MTRLALIAAAAVLVLPPLGLAGPDRTKAQLNAYVEHVGPLVKRQKAALGQLDRLAREGSSADVPAAFRAAANRMGRVARSWARIEHPQRLHDVHAGMTRSLRRTALALRVFGEGYAQYLASQDPDDLKAATAASRQASKGVVRLRTRWVRTVGIALRRAHMEVPPWLAT